MGAREMQGRQTRRAHDSCRRVEVLVVPQRRMIGRAPGFQEPAASHHGLSTVVVHFGTQENLDRVGGFLSSTQEAAFVTAS